MDGEPSPSATHIYRRPFDPGRRSSLSVLSERIAPGTRVLDVGIGNGALGAYLTHEKRCTVHGITVNPAEAEMARGGYERIACIDIERDGWRQTLDGGDYDVIVCADVLEHLRWPERVLRELPHLLRPGGLLLASVPNAGYAGFITELMHGNLEYGPEGLLDRTHLRFFTRASARRLLEQSGISILHQSESPATLTGKSRLANAISFGLVRDFFTVQYLFSGIRK